MTSVELPVRWQGQLAVVTMPDEIDMSNGDAVQERLLSILGQHPAGMVIDMTPTEFCDSAGLRAIMLTHRAGAAEGCDVRLVIPSPGVLRVFSIIGADELTEIHPHLASALGAALDGQAGR